MWRQPPRLSGRAQLGGFFAGSSTGTHFMPRESFYYNAGKRTALGRFLYKRRQGTEVDSRAPSGTIRENPRKPVASEVQVYPTLGRSSTFFVVIVTCVAGSFGRGYGS